MSKQQLQTNNAKYSQLIELLRGKAVGGGGGSLETVTLTIQGNILGPTFPGEDTIDYHLHYTNGNGEKCIDIVAGQTTDYRNSYIIAKNTLVFIVIPYWIYYGYGELTIGFTDEFIISGGSNYMPEYVYYDNQKCSIGFITEDMNLVLSVGM